MTEPSIYEDARRYDLMTSAIADGEDFAFYLRQFCKYSGPALELGCGTGRLTLPLAEQGFAMTGLDLSPVMLAYARKKAAARSTEVEWVEGDCRDFDLGRQFGLIFFPSNALCHLHDRADIEACFACVRRHLKAGGVFAFEVFNPSLTLLTRDPKRRYPVGEYPDPDSGRRLIVTEQVAYNAATQINHIQWFYWYEGDEAETVADLNLRMFFPQEIDALLHYNGFTVEAKYGDFDETPFGSTSQRQILVCSAL